MSKESFQNIIQEPAVAYKTTGSRMDLVTLSRKGLHKQALLNLGTTLQLTLKELASLLPVTERTLQRRSPGSLLSTSVSEQVILIAEVTAQGCKVFGSIEAFRGWLKQENIAFGGATPFSLLDTAIGIQLVSEELGKLAYGVYA